MHGGRCTGPRTAEGMARMIAAKTTHGRYAMSGAPKRATQLYGRAVVARILLAAAATRLWAYLPPGMAARGVHGLLELSVPIHPSNLPFVMRPATMPNNVSAGNVSAGNVRAGNVRAGAGGRTAGAGRGVAGAGLALRGRQAERAAAAVEAAARAPWQAAIAFARAAKRAAKADPMRDGPTQGGKMGDGATRGDTAGAASAAIQDVCNDPLHAEIARRAARALAVSPAAAAGPPGVTTRDVCINPLQREIAFRAAGLRASPGVASVQGEPALVEASQPPIPSPSAGAMRDARNDALQREPDAARRLTQPAPGNAEAAALAGMSRPRPGLPSAGALRDACNDTLQREPDAGRWPTRPAPGKAGVARSVSPGARLGVSLREQLDARFGRAVPAGWQPPMTSPVARPRAGRGFD